MLINMTDGLPVSELLISNITLVSANPNTYAFDINHTAPFNGQFAIHATNLLLNNTYTSPSIFLNIYADPNYLASI